MQYAQHKTEHEAVQIMSGQHSLSPLRLFYTIFPFVCNVLVRFRHKNTQWSLRQLLEWRRLTASSIHLHNAVSLGLIACVENVLIEEYMTVFFAYDNAVFQAHTRHMTSAEDGMLNFRLKTQHVC